MNNTQGALKKLHSMLHNMHEMSIRDELTGLYNRRFFSEQADLLLIRATRYEEPLSVVYVDIGHFKDVNDKFSHQFGDHALRQIGNILSDSARGSDLTARIGGDEFVTVFPNTPVAKARQLGERLLHNLASHDWEALLPGQKITASVGVAEAVSGDTLDQLLARADQFLYNSKRGARPGSGLTRSAHSAVEESPFKSGSAFITTLEGEMRKSAGGRPPGRGNNDLSRRQLFGASLKAGAAVLIPLVETSCTSAELPASSLLGPANDAILAAFADRIVPADELGPSASAAGVVRYINRSLAEWNQAELPVLRAGLLALDQNARGRHGVGFAALAIDQQDALMTALEAGELVEMATGPALFNRLHRLVLEGMFSDPYYGGNANYAGWDLIGYPGAVLASTPDMQKMRERLPALHTSAYGSDHDGH